MRATFFKSSANSCTFRFKSSMFALRLASSHLSSSDLRQALFTSPPTCGQDQRSLSWKPARHNPFPPILPLYHLASPPKTRQHPLPGTQQVLMEQGIQVDSTEWLQVLFYTVVLLVVMMNFTDIDPVPIGSEYYGNCQKGPSREATFTAAGELPDLYRVNIEDQNLSSCEVVANKSVLGSCPVSLDLQAHLNVNAVNTGSVPIRSADLYKPKYTMVSKIFAGSRYRSLQDTWLIQSFPVQYVEQPICLEFTIKFASTINTNSIRGTVQTQVWSATEARIAAPL